LLSALSLTLTAPGEAEQDTDTIFVQYRNMAWEQQWLDDIGLGHKYWSFGYSHSKAVAEESGCQGE
jgi:hypothetical protein